MAEWHSCNISIQGKDWYFSVVACLFTLSMEIYFLWQVHGLDFNLIAALVTFPFIDKVTTVHNTIGSDLSY